jgi:mycothiol synthase
VDNSSEIRIRPFEPSDSYQILALMTRSFERGELGGWSATEVPLLHSRISIIPDGTIVAVAHGRVVGVVTPRHHYLIVEPEYRRQGIGRRLAAAADELSIAKGDGRLHLAPPQGSDAAVEFLRAIGYRYQSSLWELRLPAETAVAEPAFPASIALRHYEEADIENYVDLFNRAFVSHPSPISMTVEMARQVHALPDFALSEIMLVDETGHPSSPIAFTRISVDPDHIYRRCEVMFIGVLPEWQGKGIGSNLLLWSVHALRDRGCADITLAVEAENERALRLYERVGFHRDLEWPRWAPGA